MCNCFLGNAENFIFDPKCKPSDTPDCDWHVCTFNRCTCTCKKTVCKLLYKTEVVVLTIFDFLISHTPAENVVVFSFNPLLFIVFRKMMISVHSVSRAHSAECKSLAINCLQMKSSQKERIVVRYDK